MMNIYINQKLKIAAFFIEQHKKTGNHKRFHIKYVTLPDDYRLSIDHECISFKKIYALRTEAERYNARFKQTGQERF